MGQRKKSAGSVVGQFGWFAAMLPAMQRILAPFRSVLAFLADIAQVFGTDWRSIVSFGVMTGAGGWMIGLISGYAGFPLAIGAAAIGFLSSGAMAFSKYRNRPLPPASRRTLGLDEIRHSAKPRYAPPDTKGLDIRTSTYKELGALVEAIGKDVQKFEKSIPYNATDEQIISQFHKKLASHILWAYEEVRRRGHRDSTLDVFYSDPGILRVSGIELLGKELIKMGARLTLYRDI